MLSVTIMSNELNFIIPGVIMLNVVAPNTQFIILISMFQIREREDDEKRMLDLSGNT
jgi:hypothetical protein